MARSTVLEVAPPRIVRDVVRCSYVATFDAEPYDLYPDGCVDLLWRSDGSLVLCGPETAGWSFSVPAGSTTVGVRLEPGVAGSLFRVDVDQLGGRRLEADTVLPSRIARGNSSNGSTTRPRPNSNGTSWSNSSATSRHRRRTRRRSDTDRTLAKVLSGSPGTDGRTPRRRPRDVPSPAPPARRQDTWVRTDDVPSHPACPAGARGHAVGGTDVIGRRRGRVRIRRSGPHDPRNSVRSVASPRHRPDADGPTVDRAPTSSECLRRASHRRHTRPMRSRLDRSTSRKFDSTSPRTRRPP